MTSRNPSAKPFATPFVARVLTAAVLLAAAPLFAQLPSSLHPDAAPSTQPGAASDDSPHTALGPVFQNATAEITLRPPAGMIKSTTLNADEEFAEFTDESKGWRLTVSRIREEHPVALTGSAMPGLLELSTEKLKSSGQAEILRSDTINVASTQNPDTAMIAARIATGTRSQLIQQAIVRSSDLVYYVVEFTSPGSKLGTGAENASEAEKTAVHTFDAVVDSIHIVDRKSILDDQNKRMFATRYFFLNLKEDRLRTAISPERWVRVIQDGKDIGYSYIVEEEASRANRPGVLVAVRSRTKQQAASASTPEQVDTESFMFTSFDRNYEEWSNVAKFIDKDGKVSSATEIGTSSAYKQRQAVPGALPGEKINDKEEDKAQPFVKETLRRTVTVTANGKAPVEREAGVTYIPQAIVHLLPRLLPLKDPKAYVFSSYLSDQHEIFRRYYDVLAETNVTLNGQTVRAVPVVERVGYEGAPTYHYLSKDGRYLGSVNEKAKLTILPTDAATLQQLWSNPDFSRPKAPASPTYQQP